jgi:hypothetical protein
LLELEYVSVTGLGIDSVIVLAIVLVVVSATVSCAQEFVGK